MPARVVALQHAFLLAVALENRRVQVQAVAFLAPRQTLHLPLGERREEALHVAHRKLLEEIANRVVDGESIESQQLTQSFVAAQPIGVRETLGAHEHTDQKGRPSRRRIDAVGRAPTHRMCCRAVPSRSILRR